MKLRVKNIIIAVAGLLVAIAPFITVQASACAVISGETEVPKSLLE